MDTHSLIAINGICIASIGVPDTQLTYDNTEFGFFSDSPLIDWYTAQLGCLDWGGNLATIKSEEVDSLLLYTTTDTHFTCFIGLNDILNEANGVDGDYIWVDGSSGPYRNFEPFSPSSNADRDCVRFRYRMLSSDLSQGWVNGVCSLSYNCHFCTKSGKKSMSMHKISKYYLCECFSNF